MMKIKPNPITTITLLRDGPIDIHALRSQQQSHKFRYWLSMQQHPHPSSFKLSSSSDCDDYCYFLLYTSHLYDFHDNESE